MTALSEAQAARTELHKSSYWPAALKQKGINHLWQTDVHLAATISQLTAAPPPAPVLPIKGCSPGSKILSATDRVSWELPEIQACFGDGAIVRLDYGGAVHDQVVQDALNAGLSPLLCIGGTMRTVPTPTDYTAAVTAACTRWKSKVRYIELGGNEPNGNGQTVQVHAALVNAGAWAARGVDPSLVMMNGGLSPSTDPALGSDELDYATRLIPLVKGSIGHFNMHLYEDATVRGAWNGWDRAFHPESLGGRKSVRQVLDANGMAAVPISSTESGGQASSIGEPAQATYVTDAYADFAARRASGEKVGFVLVYCMRDDEAAAGWGLCRSDHTRRPAWTAAQAA